MSTLHVEFDNSLAELQRELAIRSYYPDGGEAIVPMHLLRRLNDAMIWAGDEVTQLREDLHGTMGALVVAEYEIAETARHLEAESERLYAVA